MYLKIFLKIILVSSLAILQIAFVSGLPAGWRELNLAVIFLIFSLELGRSKNLVWWSMLIGFFFDLYLPVFFGFFMILWPLVFLFASWLSANFFTNRSLYSFLGLGFFTTVFYYLFFNLFFYLAGFFSPGRPEFFLLSNNFWLQTGFGAAANLLAVAAIFYLANLVSDRLKPVFIVKR